MKLSRKRCIAALAVVLLTGVCTINAVASGDSYNANEAQTLTNSGYTMHSKGIINTDGGKVVFDASDLNNLTAAVNECFTSASNGKKAVADGLKNVGTYFTGEGTNDYTNNATAQQKSVTYNNGASAISNSENSDYINTDNIPFSTLMDAVSHSQDIPVAVKQKQATNASGQYLYYENQTASNARDLTKVSTSNTGYPVYYGAVKPENLSAGSAAWVNGELILGTGADNNAYFNLNDDNDDMNDIENTSHISDAVPFTVAKGGSSGKIYEIPLDLSQGTPKAIAIRVSTHIILYFPQADKIYGSSSTGKYFWYDNNALPPSGYKWIVYQVDLSNSTMRIRNWLSDSTVSGDYTLFY